MKNANSNLEINKLKEKNPSLIIQGINKDKLSKSSNTLDLKSLNHCIKKKTLRGRKNQNPLPKIERCQICLEYKKYSKDKIISCSICNCKFHISCYKKPLNSIKNFDNFKCERCKISNEINKKIEECKCFICSLNNGVLFYNEENDTFYHDICVKLIPEIYEENNMEKYNRKNIRKWRFKCSCKYCNEKLSKEKAVIKCNHPKCKHYYHIPCAIEKGMIFSINYFYKFYCFDEFKNCISLPFYCSCHNKRLAGEYRKNVINNDNFDYDNFKKDFSFLSNEDTNFDNSNENCNFSIYSNEDDDFDNLEKNKMFDLNFNELLNISDNINENNNYFNNDNDSDENISFYFETIINENNDKL